MTVAIIPLVRWQLEGPLPKGIAARGKQCLVEKATKSRPTSGAAATARRINPERHGNSYDARRFPFVQIADGERVKKDL
jgi:hypothetical protein